MDKTKKETLRKIREAAKTGGFWTSGHCGFISVSNLLSQSILSNNSDARGELLRYFYEKGYLEFESEKGSSGSTGDILRITARGIDVFDPWWVQNEKVVIAGIFGIVVSILGVLLGFFLRN